MQDDQFDAVNELIDTEEVMLARVPGDQTQVVQLSARAPFSARAPSSARASSSARSSIRAETATRPVQTNASAMSPDSPEKLAKVPTPRDPNIVTFEATTRADLQELVVREAVASFRKACPLSDAMQPDALASTLASLPGRSPADSTLMPMVDNMFGHSSAIDVPVFAHFGSQLNYLEGVDLAQLTPNENGSLPQLVAFENQQKAPRPCSPTSTFEELNNIPHANKAALV